MTFGDLIGHERTAGRLQRMAADGHVPSGVLLLGPDGVGTEISTVPSITT